MIDDRCVTEFVSRMENKFPYFIKGVFPSEMFAFFCAAKDFDSGDLIIESGTGYGCSIWYLSRLFPECNIISVDNERMYKQTQFVRNDYKDKPLIEFIKGDSLEVIPRIVANTNANRIAVLIDGPKGQTAILLAKYLMEIRFNVEFVAIHDCDDQSGFFHTVHDDSFNKRFYDFFNERVDKHLRKIYPRGPGLSFFRRDS